jgi:hypothetical protein
VVSKELGGKEFCGPRSNIPRSDPSNGQTKGLAFASRAVLERRYELLPYYYTLFADAHNGVSPYVLHALIFDWADDPQVCSLHQVSPWRLKCMPVYPIITFTLSIAYGIFCCICGPGSKQISLLCSCATNQLRYLVTPRHEREDKATVHPYIYSRRL